MGRTLFIQLSRLGDNLQSTPLLAAWRRRNPQDRITLLTRAAYASVFEGNDDVDEILVYAPPWDRIRGSERTPIERLDATREWLDSLRSARFDSVVNLTHDPLSCWIAHTLNAPRTRGVAMDSLGTMRAFDPWSQYLFSLLKFRDMNLFNLCDIYAHLSGGEAVAKALRFNLDESGRRVALERLGGSGGCFIGFQPGASKPDRRWPAENFIALGCWLRESFDVRVLVFGNENERQLAETIAAAVPGASSFAGKTTLRELGALLACCRALVTNDTGTMHLASAVGTSIVALFEASAYLRETGPYGEGHWVLQSRDLKEHEERTEADLSRLARIPVAEVKKALSTVLSDSISSQVPEPAREVSSTVDHYRSGFTDGYLDFFPVSPPPVNPTLFWAYLQRPVWTSTLDGSEFDGGREARRALEYLRKASIPSESVDSLAAVGEGISLLSELSSKLLRMRNLIQSSISRLARNSNYLIPQNQISQLTELESSLLANGDQIAVRPFIACFEIGLAMVNGQNTSEYLQNYLHQVLQLSKQVRLFSALLHSARQEIETSCPHV